MYVIQTNKEIMSHLLLVLWSCSLLSLWTQNGITEAKYSLLQNRFNLLNLNDSHGANWSS
jgi:hypothetical protein